MRYKLQRWTGDGENVVATHFDTMAELIADIRANDGLTENELYEFLRIGAFSRPDRGFSCSEVE